VRHPSGAAPIRAAPIRAALIRTALIQTVLIQRGPADSGRLIGETQRSHPGRVRVRQPGEHPADVAKLAVSLANQHPG